MRKQGTAQHQKTLMNSFDDSNIYIQVIRLLEALIDTRTLNKLCALAAGARPVEFKVDDQHT